MQFMLKYLEKFFVLTRARLQSFRINSSLIKLSHFPKVTQLLCKNKESTQLLNTLLGVINSVVFTEATI